MIFKNRIVIANCKVTVNHIAKLITKQEITELISYDLPKDHPILRQYNFRVSNQGAVSFASHPFVQILGGHPQAISLAAPMLEYKRLVDLFKDFLNTFNWNDF